MALAASSLAVCPADRAEVVAKLRLVAGADAAARAADQRAEALIAT